MMYNVLFLVPLIAGIGTIVEKAGVKEKYIPLVNLFNGLVLGLITESKDFRNGFVIGLYLGLSASGFSRCSIDIFKDIYLKNKTYK
ncbi:MAG: hypothetical protein ACLFMO_05585 [Eubacteriales bacterium]